MATSKPQTIPEKGFYYHYKHDIDSFVCSYAYEVIGVGIHTEEGMCMVLYRPLYTENSIYEAGKSYYYVRPIDMFLDVVVVNGSPTPRFTKITDEEIIEQLQSVRAKLYGDL